MTNGGGSHGGKPQPKPAPKPQGEEAQGKEGKK